MAGFELPLAVILLGLIVGLTYGILAVGLVLIYRTSGIVNFAHGQVGVFAAVVLSLGVTRFGLPYWMMFPLAVLIAAGIAAIVDISVMRRLAKAPPLMSMVATLGVAQILLLLGFVINSEGAAGQLFPQPPLLPSFAIGSLNIIPAYSGMLFLTPLVVAGLVVFFRYSRIGIATRAASANPEAARLDGVYARRMSTLSWAIAGAISAFTALLVLPSQGFVAGEAMGPGLLVRALVAAVVARMQSLPRALAAGVTVGVVEQVVDWNVTSGGVVDVVLFAGVLLALLLQRREAGRRVIADVWSAVEPWAPLPDTARQVWLLRRAGPLIFAGTVAVAAVLPVFITNRAAILLITIMAYAIVGLSVGIVTGQSGQLTLGQFGIAAVGAVLSYHVSRTTGNFLAGVLVAGLVAALVSVLIGLPALRIKGLMLAVVTLAFALATQGWVLSQPWAFSSGVDPGYPLLGGFGFDTARRYYYFVLPFAIAAFWLARNLRRGGLGRRIIGVRDNEEGARAFGVPATLVKLQAFAIGGFLAGVGGAVYAHSLSLVSDQAFPVRLSIDLVAMTVIGGIGILAGPLIGALYIVGVPNFIPLDAAGLAATSFGWLILILSYPGGIAQSLASVRNRIVNALLARAGASEPKPAVLDGSFAGAATGLEAGAGAPPHPATDVLLRGTELTKRFGGITAVDNASFEVLAGETLGLIGPNGAGKTTLFELLSGFTQPDKGQIAFLSADITGVSPERRAQLGMIRSFQSAALFPTMTVLQTVMFGFERADPAQPLHDLIGLRGAERRKESRARELIARMGLESFRNKQIRELSTGTRRITELACVVALEPKLLLLDEPSAGVAQRETEALGGLLARLKQELDTTLVVIEHDIPLMMEICDRIIAMESGAIIAEGAPEAVTNHPRVIEAYLGQDELAIARSGQLAVVHE